MPHKQAASLIAIESLVQRTSFRERALDTGMSRESCVMADNEAHGAYDKMHVFPGAAEALSFFQEGWLWTISLYNTFTSKHKHAIYWSWRVWAAVDGSEGSVYSYWKQGGNPT